MAACGLGGGSAEGRGAECPSWGTRLCVWPLRGGCVAHSVTARSPSLTVCVCARARAAFRGSSAYESRMAVLERVGGAADPDALVRGIFEGGDIQKLEALNELVDFKMLGDASMQLAVRQRLEQVAAAAGGGQSEAERLRGQHQMGIALWRAGKLEEAEGVMRRVVEGRETLLGREHMHTLASVNVLGAILDARGKL